MNPYLFCKEKKFTFLITEFTFLITNFIRHFIQDLKLFVAGA